MTEQHGPSDRQVVALLEQLGGHATAGLAERLAPIGLSPSQAGLLSAVAAHPGSSQRLLAERSGTTPSRVVVLVDELAERGLLERRRDARDRRLHAVHLTRAGSEVLRAMGAAARDHGGALLSPLSAVERAALARLLGQLADHHGIARNGRPR